MFVLTAEEAADLYPEPQRIEGSMVLREVDEQAVDTTPDVFRPLPDVPASASPQRQDVSAEQSSVAKHG